jgi:hypothetical protein
MNKLYEKEQNRSVRPYYLNYAVLLKPKIKMKFAASGK